VRYLALRELLDLPADDPTLATARRAAHQSGPIAAILDGMDTGHCRAWRVEHDRTGKTWDDLGMKKQPNPWVTIRALRVL
jgi:hypothetical protein